MNAHAIFDAALALGLAVVGPWSGTLAQGEANWSVAAAPNGALTVETPCSASEIAALQSAPPDLIPNLELAPQSRVLCVKDPLIFLVGQVNAEDLPAGTTSLFDALVEQVSADRNASGRPTQTTILGRRAIVNREERDGIVAQTGFIEISRTSAVMLIAGARNSSLGVASQRQAIERFYGSISVSGE